MVVLFLFTCAVLVKFEFPEAASRPFPENGLGDFVFDRKTIVEPFVSLLTNPIAPPKQGYYFRGPRGNGKTVFLQLVGRALMERGEAVIWVEHAGFLDGRIITREQLVALSASAAPGKKVYLLVDEVQANKNSPLWTYLLEMNHSLVTIGAGDPTLGVSPAFPVKHDPTFLFFGEADIVNDAVDYFRGLAPCSI